MTTLFANRIATTLSTTPTKVIDHTGTVIPVVVESTNKAPASYSFSRRVIILRGDEFGIETFRAILAHELGHRHHQYYQENGWCWELWKGKWKQLVTKGVLDGYAAKNAQEGWAELYRLHLSCPFSPEEATRGDWQWDPGKRSTALATWKGVWS